LHDGTAIGWLRMSESLPSILMGPLAEQVSGAGRTSATRNPRLATICAPETIAVRPMTSFCSPRLGA
jgi:hypothetical protein